MLHLIDPNDRSYRFPDVELAESEPNGLLAVGGDLSSDRILAAYRQGIFPWYTEGQPILWWSPDPRTVLYPDALKISRSLNKRLKNAEFRVTFDTAFERVIHACAAPRRNQEGTWIVPEMIRAYRELHRRALAHSVEVWHRERLVGGLYGVALGRVFFGESMFSRRSDASKVALVHLARRLLDWGFPLIDCQEQTAHLLSLGACTIPRRQFSRLLDRWCDADGRPGFWSSAPPGPDEGFKAGEGPA